jgi:MFS family permease
MLYRNLSWLTVVQELKVSVHKIALTMTVYMVVQGLAPSFWGPLSDAKGRRLIFCCTISVYIIANLFLALSMSYKCLLALRALQAAGGAATISIGKL